MKKIILITGGERSGKSRYAEGLAHELTTSPVYIATAKLWDEEFRKRVERHQQNRGPEWTNIETVACPARAGSAVIHNGLVAHGAGANMTCRPRRAMTCAYMPDGSTFNGVQNVLPTEYFESLQIGDLLNDEDVNPLIWKR